MILINETAKEIISVDKKPEIVKAWLILGGRWKNTDRIHTVSKFGDATRKKFLISKKKFPRELLDIIISYSSIDSNIKDYNFISL